MGINLKSFFQFKKPSFDHKLPHDFDHLVRQAISLVKNSSDINTDEELLEYLTTNGIEYASAVEILLFLPIAFVRLLLPNAKWLDIYLEYIDEKTKIEKNIVRQKRIR